MRRFGRPGLIGTMARTAIVAGTATATVNAVNSRAQAKARAQQQQVTDVQAQVDQTQTRMGTGAAAPPPTAATDGRDLVAELEKLAHLKEAGLLSDHEFAAAKARLLT